MFEGDVAMKNHVSLMLASNMWIQHDSTIIDTRDLATKPEISPTTVGLKQLICVSLVERWILC
jgi:hypothetical protein